MGIDTPSDEFLQSIPMNQVHLCLLDINYSPDCSGLTQIQNQIHFLRNQPDRNGLVLYTSQDIFPNLESRGKRCNTKIHCGSYSEV